MRAVGCYSLNNPFLIRFGRISIGYNQHWRGSSLECPIHRSHPLSCESRGCLKWDIDFWYDANQQPEVQTLSSTTIIPTCLASSAGIIFSTVLRNTSFTEHVGTLGVYVTSNMNAKTCSSINISKVSVGFDIMIMLLAKFAVETKFVGFVPPVGPVNV